MAHEYTLGLGGRRHGDRSMKTTTTRLAILATLCSLSLAPCTTVEAVGEDVRSAADAIDDAAEDAKN